MARELDYAIQTMFRGVDTTIQGTYWHRNNSSPLSKKKYLEIPIREDKFELPLFAIKNFLELTNDNRDLSTDSITAMLFTYDREPRYKSLDRYMRDLIWEDFIHDRLVKCKVKQGDEDILYYVTHGAVFDENFFPVMLCSWEMERFWLNEETRRYRFLKPVLRINPRCYINQADPMQRWIVKKAASTGLETTLSKPHEYSLNSAFPLTSEDSYQLKVEICDSPFIIKAGDTPSISTTNESLLQLAIDHIDEIIS